VTEEVKHLSPSKIEGTKCMESFRLRYVEKIPEPSGGTFLAGRVVHGVLERAMKRVMLGSGLPSAKEADDWFVALWKEEEEGEEAKPAFMGWNWDENRGDSKEKAYRECRALVPFALTDVVPGIKPRLIEEDAKMNYESELGPFLVWGRLDLYEEGGIVSDWKTTRKVSKNATESWLQLAHYSRYAHEVMEGPEVTRCRKIFLIRGATPKADLAWYDLTPAKRAWFARVAAEVWKAVKTNTFVPNPSGWWCSSDWCSYWAICQGEL